MSSPAMVPSWRMPPGFRCTERLGFGSSSPLCLVRHCNPPEFFLAVHYNRFSGPGVNLPRGSPSGAVVSFHLESDLLEPVSTWLQVAGFDLFEEVPIVRHRADLVGLRGDGVTAIEMKLRKWDEALRQAIAYQIAADWAWVAMPLSSAFKAYHQRWRFEAERVAFPAGKKVSAFASVEETNGPTTNASTDGVAPSRRTVNVADDGISPENSGPKCKENEEPPVSISSRSCSRSISGGVPSPPETLE